MTDDIGLKLKSLQLTQSDQTRLKRKAKRLLRRRNKAVDRRTVELHLSNIRERLERLTEALIDGLIEQDAFRLRKERMIEEQVQLQASLNSIGKISEELDLVEKFLELAKNLYLTYQMGNPSQKRRIAEVAFSNLQLDGKKLVLTPQKWCQDTGDTINFLCGAPDRDTTRTREQIAAVVEATKTRCRSYCSS